MTHLFLIHKLLVCLPSSVLAETAVAGPLLAICGDRKWLLIKTRPYLFTHMNLNSENFKKAFKAVEKWWLPITWDLLQETDAFIISIKEEKNT